MKISNNSLNTYLREKKMFLKVPDEKESVVNLKNTSKFLPTYDGLYV